MSPDFYVGQPVDDVLKIASATGRKRRKVEFTGKEGTFVFKKDHPPPRGTNIDMSQDFTVKYFYDDCTLTFQRSRGPDGNGALCYRVTEVDDVPGSDS